MFKFDPADVSPNLYNWLIVGLMAISFILFFKFVVTTFNNPVTDRLKPVAGAV